MRTKYMDARNQREEIQQPSGRFRGGKLVPVLAVPFMQSEGGMVQQSVEIELDPIAGELSSEMTLEVVSVFVPALAMEALNNPNTEHPGNAEIFRKAHLSGQPIFDLEYESEISKRLGIEPIKVNGQKFVSEEIYLAHHCAVNHLRQLKYIKAVQLTKNSPKTITPALLSSTVLDRFNAVLDPEDNINGAVALLGQANVQGIGYHNGNPNFLSNAGVVTSDGVEMFDKAVYSHELNESESHITLEIDPTNNQPMVRVDFGAAGQVLSLKQFYQAERMDELTRQMRKLVDDNPQYGEEIVTRMVHGLHVDSGKEPFVVYQREVILGKQLRTAMDGPNLDTSQTDTGAAVSFAVPIPQTEFGGTLMTFASLKPDEVLRSQPHPVYSKARRGRNYVVDELAIDPDPVQIRDLDGECSQADENKVAMYTGRNHMYRRYVNYGFNRHIDPTTVQNKNTIWQLEIPVSVTPQTVLYPADIPHYPWVDQNAEVVRYRATSRANIATPLIYGPTPLEELQEIENENLFEPE